MITQHQANYYNEVLHPTFAGYLLDGKVNQRDMLATILHFLKKDYLHAQFEDNNMLKQIQTVSKGMVTPKYKFEKEIIEILFKEKNILNSHEIGESIQKQDFKYIIDAECYHNKFSNYIDLKEEMSEWTPTRKEVLQKKGYIQITLPYSIWEKIKFRLTTSILGGLVVSVVALLLPNENNNDTLIQLYSRNSTLALFIHTIIFVVASILIFASADIYTKKFVNLIDKNIIPKTKIYYDELSEFIMKNPLRPHTFTNEFLAFAVAFGLDISWNKDFGLPEEEKPLFTPNQNVV